jgi:hypothetical protein
MLVFILEDVERQRELLHAQEGNVIGCQFEKFLDLMNRAEYHLQELEAEIQKPS